MQRYLFICALLFLLSPHAESTTCEENPSCESTTVFPSAYNAIEVDESQSRGLADRVTSEVQNITQAGHKLIRHKVVRINETALLAVKSYATDILQNSADTFSHPLKSENLKTKNIALAEQSEYPLNVSFNLFESGILNELNVQSITLSSTLDGDFNYLVVSSTGKQNGSDYHVSISYNSDGEISIKIYGGYNYSISPLQNRQKLHLLTVTSSQNKQCRYKSRSKRYSPNECEYIDYRLCTVDMDFQIIA